MENLKDFISNILDIKKYKNLIAVSLYDIMANLFLD